MATKPIDGDLLGDTVQIKDIKAPSHSYFAGFAAGLCSGCVILLEFPSRRILISRCSWTKLVVGHPFDTIKVCSS
jgi:hypothetical protein